MPAPYPASSPEMGLRRSVSGRRTYHGWLAVLLLLVSIALWQAWPLRTSSSASAPTLSAAPRATADSRALALAVPKHGNTIDGEIVKLQRVAKAQPGRADVWLLLGQAWVRKARETTDPGYYLNANASAEALLSVSPGNLHGSNLQALVLLNQHRFHEARKLAQSIIEKDPDNAMAWGSLSDAALELGDDQAAFQAAGAMAALKPNLPSYSRVSYLQWLRGDSKAALESIRLAIDAAGDPGDKEPRAWALVQAAQLFWHRGDYDGADAGYQQALEVWRNYGPALIGRGRVALARGEPTRAVRSFQAALDASPSAEAAWLLALSHRSAGNALAADAALKRSHDEGRRADQRALSLIYASEGVELEEAVRLARAEKAQRGDIYTDDALGWALFKAGRAQEAKQSAERALRLGTKDARLLFHRGAILLATGDTAAGRKLLAQALELNPRFDPLEADEAKRLLGAK
jgi:tetratricopeptide (TPR) repeat protein